MENLIINETTIYTDLFYKLIGKASERILAVVQANGGRITISTPDDAWDEEASDVKEAVKDRSVELSIDNGSGNLTMYPIDFIDNNGYVLVLLMDYYGDQHQIYTDKMEDADVCSIADFIGQSFGQVIKSEAADLKIYLDWSVEDVLAQAENDEVEITTEEAKDILQLIERKHDANIGVNWDVITALTDIYLDTVKPKEPFERFLYNDRVYLVRDAVGYIVAGYDLRDELIDKATGLPKSLHEQFVANDIAYYASEAEMALSAEQLKQLIDQQPQ